MQPLVSVIIPCYNHEAYIQECIQSILNQTYKNIELIVIDDGSKDRSVTKIEELSEQCKIRFENFNFITRENKGLCNTLNEALALCKGEYVSIIASDDIMTPNKIQIQIEYALKNPDVTSFYGAVQLIDDLGHLKEKKDLPLQFYDFEDVFMHNFVLYAPTQMHNLKDLLEIGGFDANVKIEDWDLWLRLTKKGKKILCIPEFLAYYRIHENNMSADLDFMFTELIEILNKYQDEVLFKKAKFNIVKQYKLKPIKKLSKLKYYFMKISYLMTGAI